MAGRILILSGAAVFALGAISLGALFEEPGGDASHRRPAPLTSATGEWGEWIPLPPEPTASKPAGPALAESAEPEEAATPDEPPLPHVWATPAEWSEVE